jgi:hypothetical protein
MAFVRRIGMPLLWLGLALGVITQVIDLPLNIVRETGKGHTALYAIVHYFGFLSIIANIWVTLIYLALALPGRRALDFFRSPTVHVSAAATILLVMLFQHFILRPTSAPNEGINILIDLSYHYLGPGIYLLWWLSILPERQIGWRKLPLVLLPGVLYPLYVLVRGPLAGEYPYSSIDVNAHGYPYVLAYMVQVAVGFTIVCAVLLTVNTAARMFSKRSAEPV